MQFYEILLSTAWRRRMVIQIKQPGLLCINISLDILLNTCLKYNLYFMGQSWCILPREVMRVRPLLAPDSDMYIWCFVYLGTRIRWTYSGCVLSIYVRGSPSSHIVFIRHKNWDIWTILLQFWKVHWESKDNMHKMFLWFRKLLLVVFRAAGTPLLCPYAHFVCPTV